MHLSLPRSLARIGAAALIVLLCAGLLPAQQPALVTALSLEDIRSLLRGMELEYREDSTGEVATFDFELDDYDIILFRYEASIMVQTSFADDFSVEIINDWNRNFRYGRAYRSDNGEPYLEADLDLEPGVTMAAIEAFIRRFPSTIDSYVVHLNDSDEGQAKDPAPEAEQEQ